MDAHHMDDDAAVTAVLDGDAEAYAVLVERYQVVAFRTAYLVVRDADGAEDVAREGFIRAYRELSRFSPRRAVPSVAAADRDEPRVERGAIAGAATGDARAPVPQPRDVDTRGVASCRGGGRQRELLEAIGRLGHDDQVVLSLRHFLDLPEREIATAIGKRPGTVKSRLSRARGDCARWLRRNTRR